MKMAELQADNIVVLDAVAGDEQPAENTATEALAVQRVVDRIYTENS